jgi:hypothetical protein
LAATLHVETGLYAKGNNIIKSFQLARDVTFGILYNSGAQVMRQDAPFRRHREC